MNRKKKQRYVYCSVKIGNNNRPICSARQCIKSKDSSFKIRSVFVSALLYQDCQLMLLNLLASELR